MLKNMVAAATCGPSHLKHSNLVKLLHDIQKKKNDQVINIMYINSISNACVYKGLY